MSEHHSDASPDPVTQDQVDLDEVRAGLRMSHPPDPEQLAAEKARLASLEDAPVTRRWAYFARLSGPGFLQSAMTLGGGSAASALFAGAAFGYDLLWVGPIGMLIGVTVLSAVSHQTLSTGMRPFEAMNRFAGAPFAWMWAIGALLASIIWHIPQYSLAAGAITGLFETGGIDDFSPMVASAGVLVWALAVSSLYGRSPGMVRTYERMLKYLVWGVVLCFAVVVARTGVDLGEVASGFFSFRIPGEVNGISGTEIIVASLASAVGINMVFLYPYSLLARGWGREHRQLARFDLITGMLVPYAVAVSLMVIATANTLHVSGFTGKNLRPIDAATMLEPVIGVFGQGAFLLGVLGMALSTITLHMLAAGFVCSELFGWKVGSRAYRFATLLPTPAFLAPLVWSDLVWIAVPTTIVCGLFLPAAYVAFALMHGKRDYLGADTTPGLKGKLWRAGIWMAAALITVSLAFYIKNELAG